MRTAEQQAWSDIKQRCNNPSHQSYADYGGRGITICPEWENNFDAFYAYVGPRPNGHTVERIDNNKGYEPGNVKWATQAEQIRNTRATVRVVYKGEDYCLKDLCEKLGKNYDTVKSRYSREGRNHWTLEQALDIEPPPSQHKSTSQCVMFQGERVTIPELAARVGMDVNLLRSRVVKLGWDVERAVSTPLRRW